MGNVITGTDLTIDVGKNYKGKLKIYGKTEQKTRSGKNKFDRNKVYLQENLVALNGTGITTKNCWGTTIMTNANVMEDLELSKTYTCIAKVKCVSKPTALSSTINHNTILMLYNPNTSAQKTILLGEGKNNWVVGTTYNCRTTFVTPEDLTGFKLITYNYYGNNDGSETYAAIGEFEITDLMLLEGDVTNEEFELYGVSPSPEFSSEIENVEGKNLFSLDDLSNNSTRTTLEIKNSSVIITAIGTTGAQYSVKYIKELDSTKSYTFSFKGKKTVVGTEGYSYIQIVVAGSNDGETYSSLKTLRETSPTENTEYSFLHTFTGYSYYRFYIYNNASTPVTVGEQTEYYDIQFEEGTVATEYVPYNSLAVKVTGKNLFDSQKLIDKGAILKDDGSYYFEKTLVDNNFMAISTNKQITLSYWCKFETDEGKRGTFFQFIYSDGTKSDGIENSGKKYSNKFAEFIMVSDKTKEVVGIAKSYGYQIGTYLKDIQLEVGDTVTTYKPYKEQTVYFPLTEGQKLYEGSYLAEDGIHNTKKQSLLNGNSGWGTVGSRYFITAPKLIVEKTNVEITVMSDKLKATNYNYLYHNNGMDYLISNCGTNGGSKRIFVSTNIEETGIQTLEDFKAWLNANPIIVEYYLAEEEIVPYTAEQQEAWNQIQNIYLFEGKNYFNNINKLKPDLELIYLKIVDDDTDFYISENGRLVIPEYDINYLIDFSASNIPSMPEAMEATVRVVGKDGDIPLNTTYEPIPFSIVCYTDDNLTPDEKVREEQKINRFMDSIKNKTKVLGFERENKFYDVKYNGVLTTVRFPAHVQFTIPVKSSESYAKDLIKKRIQGNGSENSETIKEVGAVFTIRGPAQTPKISFNNYHMEFDEVLLENTELIIDSNKSTATHVNHTLGVKTNVMKHYNHEFPKVRFGENVLAVNSGINDASQVKVEWNDLKL